MFDFLFNFTTIDSSWCHYTMKVAQKEIKISNTPPSCEWIYKDLQQTFDSEIINLLKDIIGFNETALTTPFRFNFHRDDAESERNNWILGQIANGTAEISSSSLILTRDISNISHYSAAIDTFRPQLYFKAKLFRDEFNLYRAPFSREVWMSFVAAVFLLTLSLTCVLRKETELQRGIHNDIFERLFDVKLCKNQKRRSDLPGIIDEDHLRQREKWQIGEILLVCLGALCQQSSARDPSTHAARILLLVLFVMSALSYTAYSASIIGLISLWPYTEQEKYFNLRGLPLENILLHDIENIENYVKLDGKTHKKVSLQEGFAQVMSEKSHFIGHRDVSLTFFNRQNYSFDTKCKLGRAHLGIIYQRVFPLRKNSEYKEKINYNILRLKEFGLLHRLKSNIYDMKVPCTQSERSLTTKFITFNGKDVWPALRLFIIGAILSIIIFWIEKFIRFESIQTIISLEFGAWLRGHLQKYGKRFQL